MKKVLVSVTIPSNSTGTPRLNRKMASQASMHAWEIEHGRHDSARLSRKVLERQIRLAQPVD